MMSNNPRVFLTWIPGGFAAGSFIQKSEFITTFSAYIPVTVDSIQDIRLEIGIVQ